MSQTNRKTQRMDRPAQPTPRYGRIGIAAFLALVLVFTGCSGSDSSNTGAESADSADSSAADSAGLRLVSAEDAAGIIDSPPENLVILDVRTSEEFAEGHIEGAIMLDFYRDDFADELAKLDPSVPYVLYCRSGNRSGQTISLMEDLGFADVADVDGGIGGWLGAGLPVVVP